MSTISKPGFVCFFHQKNSLLLMEAFDKIQAFALSLDCVTVDCCSNLPEICNR